MQSDCPLPPLTPAAAIIGANASTASADADTAETSFHTRIATSDSSEPAHEKLNRRCPESNHEQASWQIAARPRSAGELRPEPHKVARPDAASIEVLRNAAPQLSGMVERAEHPLRRAPQLVAHRLD